jgi:hypothetical protein
MDTGHSKKQKKKLLPSLNHTQSTTVRNIDQAKEGC